MKRIIYFAIFTLSFYSCSLQKNARFSDSYIREHKDKFEVAIPEIQELANILVALSKVGQIDSNMIDMTTSYHKEVLKYFQPFVNHPIIDVINKNIKKPNELNSIWYYYALKMNACAYNFDTSGKIKHNGIIKKMGFKYPDDPIRKNVELMNDFSVKSNFREFYKSHMPYYDSLVSIYKELNPIDKMSRWLESKFGFRYGNYTVVFSPLVGGAHATQKYKDNGFEQTYMHVRSAIFINKYSKNVNEMLNSRTVFTEIDHNFVNPISDRHNEEINKAFSVKGKWEKFSEESGVIAYSSPYAVFNEYMTWAFFSLYCLDNFSKEDVNIMMDKMEYQMVKKRNFIKFDDFNQKLMSLYKSNNTISIKEIYSQMLKWSEEQ